jgi:hypothetical protein
MMISTCKKWGRQTNKIQINLGELTQTSLYTFFLQPQREVVNSRSD